MGVRPCSCEAKKAACLHEQSPTPAAVRPCATHHPTSNMTRAKLNTSLSAEGRPPDTTSGAAAREGVGGGFMRGRGGGMVHRLQAALLRAVRASTAGWTPVPLERPAA